MKMRKSAQSVALLFKVAAEALSFLNQINNVVNCPKQQVSASISEIFKMT